MQTIAFFVFVSILVLLDLLETVKAQNVSDNTDVCFLDNGRMGRCMDVSNCESAKHDLTNGISPKTCPKNGTIRQQVCCRPGAKAEHFCDEYFKTTLPPSIVRGAPVTLGDYQHMVALGYGPKDSVQWLCGGSLISPKFVLTAAHCLHSHELGPVQWLRIGKLNLTGSERSLSNTTHFEYQVINRYQHPMYRYPSKYHDIALLEIDRELLIGLFTFVPACINTKYEEVPQNATPTVTGWGLTSFVGDRSQQLLEANLTISDPEKCRMTYAKESKRRLKDGIVNSSQICAHGEQGQDTCKGDSGGPLQILHPKYAPSKYYLIFGVTSFGKGCGEAKTPAVYTRVSHYVDWIENIVWKNETIY